VDTSAAWKVEVYNAAQGMNATFESPRATRKTSASSPRAFRGTGPKQCSARPVVLGGLRGTLRLCQQQVGSTLLTTGTLTYSVDSPLVNSGYSPLFGVRLNGSAPNVAAVLLSIPGDRAKGSVSLPTIRTQVLVGDRSAQATLDGLKGGSTPLRLR
jgi:hypothetical protein